jgi:3-dehydroquinate synthase
MNKCLFVNIPSLAAKSYRIVISTDLLTNPDRWCPKNHNIVIITDHSVKKRYGNQLANILKKQGKHILLLSISPGEQSKTAKTKQRLEEKMLQHRYNRDTLILALGGGVIGDIAGFIAATYMRGISFIQIPTTFLAMVDSSVGGKTGIDTPQGKNLIGVYWQPKGVISDINCLMSLPKKQLINGLIEAIKMFLTCDKKSFDYANKNMNKILDYDKKFLMNIIYRAASIKANVIQQDEQDNNLRMILNFGHTIGHALESISNYTLMHGQAVGLGILLESKIAELLGILSTKHFILIAETFSKLGIQAKQLKKYSIKKIIQASKIDKKAIAEKTRYVLLKDIGTVYKKNSRVAHVVDDQLVKQAYLELIRNGYRSYCFPTVRLPM